MKDLLSKLVLAIGANWVQDVAELVLSENDKLSRLNKLLVDISDVHGSLRCCHKPLLTSFSLDAVVVSEGLSGLKEKRSRLENGNALKDALHLLVIACDIEANISDEPFFSGKAFCFLVVFGLSGSSHLESLVRLDDDGLHMLHDLDGHVRNVDLGSEFHPLVSSNSLLSCGIGVVSDCLEFDGAVSRNHWHLLDLHEVFSGVEREWLGCIGLCPDLTVSDVELGLELLGINISLRLRLLSLLSAFLLWSLKDKLLIGISHDWVVDQAVVVWLEEDERHWHLAGHDGLMILLGEVLWP